VHVAPDHLRAVRQRGLVVRLAALGSMVYAHAEVAAGGSAGTALEQPCTDPHWGFVLDGSLRCVGPDGRREIAPGSVFHVQGGSEHHFESLGPVVVAAFQPLTGEDISDARLAELGFEPAVSAPAALIAPAVSPGTLASGEVRCEAWAMGRLVVSRVRMGERSGYTSNWCDVPHWGVVTAGRLAIEWEDDVEILSRGDIFHTPAGPPAHRIEAADPAAFVDLTPVDAIAAGGRVADWRRTATRERRRPSHGTVVAKLE
jgi:mannose-6-phosphate isomerase-like protein (cupin superfamily)